MTANNTASLLAMPVLWAGLAWAAPPKKPPAAAGAAAGAALFSGQVRFQNGGPACLACHSVGGLRFPNGGTLGPDLTQVATRLGPQGLSSALTTLYFPAMTPLYLTRPLTPPERSAVAAFLQQASGAPPASDTATLAGLAGVLFLLFLWITWAFGRQRLRGVRRRLVERAQRAPRRETPAAKGDGP